MNKGTLIAIPVHNEAENVAEVLERTRRFGARILVVEDGSTDGTEGVIARFPEVVCIRHPVNLGYGRSLKDAFDFAIQNDFLYVITLDADGQHVPELIPRFDELAPFFDIVSGSRYLLKGFDVLPPDVPPERFYINLDMTAILNRRFNLGISDAFCGYKAYAVRLLRRLRLTEDGYAMPMQLWAQAARLGFTIAEIPVPLIYKDARRSFGVQLDNPPERRRYYLEVFHRALCGRLPGERRPEFTKCCSLDKNRCFI